MDKNTNTIVNVLILGHNGMLGHMVKKTLDNNERIKTFTLDKRFPDWDKSLFKDYDYIINCIGAIPQKTKTFNINWEIPEWLESNVECRIIHPSTDCEIDDDDYGLSKRRAATFIKDNGTKT